MRDTTTIALAGIIATATTGLGGPFVAGWLASKREARSFGNERLQRDFDEIRGLLDQGAEALTKYANAVETLEARFMFDRSTDLNSYLEAITDTATARTDAYAMHRRLVIRLGRTHAVSAAFSRCLNLWDEGGTHVGTCITKRTGGYGDQMDQFLPGSDARKVARQETQEAFLDTATGLVGSPVKPLTA